MNFGDATGLLKSGNHIRRRRWVGTEMMSVHLVDSHLEEDGTGVYDHMVLNTSNGCIQPGWVPSTADVLASDWELVPCGESEQIGNPLARNRRILDAVAKGAPFLIGGYLEYVAPETAKAIADIMDAFESK